MSGPPVHYDCDICDCSPCACEREAPHYECDLAEFISEEHARIERFRIWYASEMAKREVTPEGDPMFPETMPPGEWDQQMLAFTDEEG